MKMGCKHSLPTDNTKTRNTLVCTSAAWFIWKILIKQDQKKRVKYTEAKA
jgi:hypothetical protein